MTSGPISTSARIADRGFAVGLNVALVERRVSGRVCFVVRYRRAEIHRSALEHGVAAADIKHAVEHVMVSDLLDDDLVLYLGPSRSAALLEVVVLPRSGRDDLVIHAMTMREKYRRLLPGGS